MREFFRKEKPLLGLEGSGGGLGFFGGGASGTGMQASGGIINDYSHPNGNKYRAHIFTSSGTFVVSALSQGISDGDKVEYLVVAGGGGGGGYASQSGGGGAGGFRTNLTGHPVKAADYTVAAGSYTVTVGAGGMGGTANPPSRIGKQGGNSEFYPTPVSYPSTARIRSVGGGGGAGYAATPSPVMNGGSGGGASHSTPYPNSGGTAATDPNHPQVAGYAGGDNVNYGSSPYGGGGGGGAGRVGAPDSPSTPLTRSTGGYGLQALIAGPPADPQPVGAPGPGSGASATGYFAGGGGGGSYNAGGLAGGYGGGAPGGGTDIPSKNGPHASSSTGGGGGGSGYVGAYGNGGNGGSGIVVLRYQIGSEELGTAKATGGFISFYNGKTIHTFTNSGTFVNPSSIDNVEVVMVAGGGSGGLNLGGGGGAGAYLESPSTGYTFPNNTYTITIGAGGAGKETGGSEPGISGGDTHLSYPGPYTWTAPGGGHGGGYTNIPAAPGGSGGGGAPDPASNSTGAVTNASPQVRPLGTLTLYGNSGGTVSGVYNGGGGGGAGGVGGSNPAPNAGGPGGIGKQLPATFRSPAMASALGTPGPAGTHYVAGGGGGTGYSTNDPNNRGIGGFGGGGDGGYFTNSPPQTNGFSALVNTGSGGGGAGYSSSSPSHSGSGGSGIVLIAYPT